MNKMQMAHEYVVAMLKTPAQLTGMSDKDIAIAAFNLADAMQAEADERINKERPDVLNMANSPQLEWQPDWSQAPDDATYWAMDKNHTANFFKRKPEITNGNGWDFGSVMQGDNTHTYQGNWQDSLRKRPESIKNIDPKEYIDAVLQDIVDPCDHEWTHIKYFGAEGDFYVCPCGAKSKHARGRK